jgi:hypothetical protein
LGKDASPSANGSAPGRIGPRAVWTHLVLSSGMFQLRFIPSALLQIGGDYDRLPYMSFQNRVVSTSH